MLRLKLLRNIGVSIAFVIVIACGSGATEDAVDVVVADEPATLENRLIGLVDALDDPGHYCIDIPGFGSGIRLQAPLQAHTCKPDDNRDEQFTYIGATSQLRSEEYDLCMQPQSAIDGVQIYLQECSNAPLQKFDNAEDGMIRLSGGGSTSLCVAVASGDGIVINPIHKRRELYVKSCENTESSLITWAFTTSGFWPDS
jgi:hypothetical protein